jgi:fructose-1-phosphate kinase PfkB-like protein
MAAKPDFAKPNREEAAVLFGKPIDSELDADFAIRKMEFAPSLGIAISLGAKGMVYRAARNMPALFAPALPLQPRSTVGCGDAALAGFAYAIGAGLSATETLRLATACAAANCLADAPGAARLEDIQKFRSLALLRELSSGP